MKTLLAVTALLAALPTGAALAGPLCQPATAPAQSHAALLQMAGRFDWRIDRLKVDDSCYQLRVTDDAGNVLKVSVDPVSLDVVSGRVVQWGPGVDGPPLHSHARG